MYFHENQLIEASQYLIKCKTKDEEKKSKGCEDDYCFMPEYFDIPNPFLRGLTVRAEYKDETFHILITPHWECFRYELLMSDYRTLLSTPFLVDKIKELFQDQKYCVKIENKDVKYEGDLDKGIYKCEKPGEEQNCFFVI
jgi:hypothetical protein